MTSLHRVCSLFLHSCSATDALVWVHLYHPRRSFSASSFPNVLVRRIESKKASLRKSYAPHKETSVHQDKPKIMAPQRNRRRDQREGDQWQRPRQNYGDVRYGRTDYAPQQTAYNSTAYHDAYDYNYGPAAVRRYRQNEHGVHTYFDDHEVYTSGHTSYQQMGMVPQNRNQYYHPRTPDASSYRPNAMPWASAQPSAFRPRASQTHSFPQPSWPSDSWRHPQNSAPLPPTAFASRNMPAPRRISPPRAPIPTHQYLKEASREPECIGSPQPLLIILDMNGTLIHRKRRAAPSSMVKRPGLDDFLAHIFNKYKIMIWTSSKPATVKEVKKRLFPPPSEPEFVAIWTRDMLGLTPQQYNEKVQVYKRLDQIWKDQSIQSHYPKPDHEKDHENYAWNQRNTILIDDSRVKAAGHPHNIIEIPEFTNDTAVDEKRNMSIVLRQLRVLSHQQDVSRKIRTWADKQRAADPKLPYVEFWEAELESDEHALGLTEVIPIPGMKPEEKKKKKTKKQKKQEKEKEDKEEERKKNKKNQQESQLDTSSDVEKQITEAQTSLETNMHIGKDRKAHFDGLSDVTDDGNESDDISDNDDDEEDNGVDLFVPPNIIENDPATSETPRRRR